MADWFKFFENDLDETRLQYAIHKLPEVVSVWVGILSECCRHKSDTVRWGSNEIELFGFSHRLNLSLGKVNEAIKLLCEIEYIQMDPASNTLKVLKWNNKQSEYCQKRAAKNRVRADGVGTVSGQCPPRGEERRREESISPNPQGAGEKLPEIPPMPRQDFDRMAEMRGVSKDCAEWFWNDFDGRNWVDKNGQAVRKVEPLLLNFWVKWQANRSRQNGSGAPSRPQSVFANEKPELPYSVKQFRAWRELNKQRANLNMPPVPFAHQDLGCGYGVEPPGFRELLKQWGEEWDGNP